MRVLNNVTEAIGNTHMLHLSKIVDEFGVQGNIYAKMEYLNPGFSKKDRVALQMITEAENAGLLVPGQAVVELTSGNTGTGLAIACACKGYKFIACMSKGNSMERARMMKALGAEVVLVDQMPNSVHGQVSGEDLALVEIEAQRITKERNAFRADQFNLEACNHAHENYTAEEMWEQLDGNIDVFVDFLGSGSTFAGCSKALKGHKSSIKCYVVEPKTAAIYSGKEITDQGHKIQGGGYSMDLPLVDKKLIDGYIQITDEEATDVARKLAKLEGVFAGFSSGANVCAAIKLLKSTERGKNIVLTLNDSGLKYLSTDLYEEL
ncbi:PLP-dependent cysteine synthase family protein [Clostridioides difficile]|uniref:O-acetylserine (Thiol)-lyase (O-acetylserine sulfhydrylase) (OAS-TL) n=2 Tax=Clostridioides difficile TaxID=1496 RepID=A0AAX3H8Q3_CLODI|nr:cysteine synthase family protein [Clostridioides difficile]AVD35174.1 cysteine synthase family protein [Clostridioides difficile]AVD37965.1 cysteine synthase family protein [Clostridioides difficile]AVD41498.1 cysteine synthase family protein [Clostridioides difficile]AXU67996.1 cysteine synthase A [Clostridioides difficile]AXU90183.1 cysteine synthase A [Clostridioides difficile]